MLKVTVADSENRPTPIPEFPKLIQGDYTNKIVLQLSKDDGVVLDVGSTTMHVGEMVRNISNGEWHTYTKKVTLETA